VPTRVELEREFGASNHTVQAAMGVLARDGFVRAAGRCGTFVTEHPPCLTRFGLVFEGHPFGRWTRFMDAIAAAAGLLEARRGGACRLPVFYDVDERTDTHAYGSLLADVRARRMAGLIFTNAPFVLKDTPLLMEPGMPRVAIESEVNPLFPHVPVRYPDLESFTGRALDFVASDDGGRRQRVAFVCFGVGPRGDRLIAAARQRGLRVEPWWIQSPSLGDAEAVRACVQLLFRATGDERPDALVIADDNYVEDATQGLAATGLRIPQDVAVVAHCNYPTLPPAAVPVVRLGFDTTQLVTECVDCLAAQRAGEHFEPARLLPAWFDSELGDRGQP
jgi:hypothetical protein